jgi:hypothetical protein
MALTFQNLQFKNLNSGEILVLENLVAFCVFADNGSCTLETNLPTNNTINIPQGTAFNAEITSSNIFPYVSITCNSGSARVSWLS